VSLEVEVTTDVLTVVETPYTVEVTETNDGLVIVETGVDDG
jgi:hypothetical protein